MKKTSLFLYIKKLEGNFILHTVKEKIAVKILHINAGLEEGGGKSHILSLLNNFSSQKVELLTLEEGEMAKEAREKGIPVIVLRQAGRYDLSILKKLKKIIKNGKYDIIHTHGARANFIVFLIHKSISPKWITTVHSDPTKDFFDRGLKGKVFGQLNLMSLSHTDGIIVVTESLKKKLSELSISSEKIYVIYNGIDFTYSKHMESHKNDKFTLTIIARLHPIKGHRLLLDSLKKESFTCYELNIIGGGELLTELKSLVIKNPLKGRVKFWGPLKKEKIESILDETDLTLLTSYSEGFPLTLLESARQKVPFISTNVGDIKKLIPNDSYGWLVETNNSNEIRLALEEAYNEWEQGILYKKGEKVFQLAATQYSLKNMVEKTEDVYACVVKNEKI